MGTRHAHSELMKLGFSVPLRRVLSCQLFKTFVTENRTSSKIKKHAENHAALHEMAESLKNSKLTESAEKTHQNLKF